MVIVGEYLIFLGQVAQYSLVICFFIFFKLLCIVVYVYTKQNTQAQTCIALNK